MPTGTRSFSSTKAKFAWENPWSSGGFFFLGLVESKFKMILLRQVFSGLLGVTAVSENVQVTGQHLRQILAEFGLLETLEGPPVDFRTDAQDEVGTVLRRSGLPREYRGARTCEAWFQLTFRPQKWNLKAHMWYQLSPFSRSNAAIAMQHHPGNIHQSVATPRYSATPWYVLVQLPNVIDTISKRWRSKKAFNTSPFHIFL